MPKWKLKSADWPAFHNCIDQIITMEPCENDLDLEASRLGNIIIKAAGKHIPKTKKSENTKRSLVL